jgi:Transcriptional Coactivator p15 (PC4)
VTLVLQGCGCTRSSPCMSLQEAEDTSYGLDLSHNRRATVTEYKAEWRVDLREYYEVTALLNTLQHAAAYDAGLLHIYMCSAMTSLLGGEP